MLKKKSSDAALAGSSGKNFTFILPRFSDGMDNPAAKRQMLPFESNVLPHFALIAIVLCVTMAWLGYASTATSTISFTLIHH